MEWLLHVAAHQSCPPHPATEEEKVSQPKLMSVEEARDKLEMHHRGMSDRPLKRDCLCFECCGNRTILALAETLQRTDKALSSVLSSKPVRDADECLVANEKLLCEIGALK